MHRLYFLIMLAFSMAICYRSYREKGCSPGAERGKTTENLWTLHPFGPGDTIELTSIGVSFLIDAVYENVMLPDDSPADA
jgi:hypothetical protein